MEFRQVVALVLVAGCVIGAGPGMRGPALAASAGRQVSDAQQTLAPALTISGTVLRSDKTTPVAGMSVRLRSLEKATIVGTTVSNKEGAFSFPVSDSGRYVVEAVETGRVVAVGDPVILAASSVITNVILPASHKSVVLLLVAIASGAGVVGLISGTTGTTSPER